MTRTFGLTTLGVILVASQSLAQAVMEPPEGFARVDLAGNDETLTCMVGGDGSTMLLLHGWPQTAAEWKPVLPALSAAFTVYACDLPGVRESTNADGDYTKSGIADDIHAAIAGADIGPVHLVGHDIGLMVAYAYASAFPDEVATLTLMDAPLPGSDVFDGIAANPSAWHFSFHMVEEVPEAIVGNSTEFYIRHFMTELWAGPAGPPEDVVAAAVDAYEDPDTLHAGFEWYRAFPQDAEDNAIKFATPLPMPVLALNAGAISPEPFVLEMMRPLASDLRGGAIEGSGHWLTEEAPDAVSSRILDFLSEVGAR
ncbi:alpha/beta hydrolase [Jannaschia sp. S6380]|uniref:alpha/beta fold hydrolase n=1 Tax=Jannaschia sp. S6380 TaxID=2926408 RepID=UPI001FF54360|nr:alpha/beta hydrolase [Jannaschia sp. S6380]MCK0167263.1 alpha/beta hydrolase [Jannaschia sp. S6380]